MLTQDWKLSTSLRAPAISRLQKIHNVEVAFKELTHHGVELEGLRGGRVTPRDIVEGHREKTLGVLWQLIFKFQVQFICGLIFCCGVFFLYKTSWSKVMN